MLRKFFRDSSRRNRKKKKSQIKRVSPLATLLAAGLGSAALAVAQSNPYPTYTAGPQLDGSWVVSSGQVITPTGTQVNLGIRVRAKAVALQSTRRFRSIKLISMRSWRFRPEARNWSRISTATSGSSIIGGACCRRIASPKSITRN